MTWLRSGSARRAASQPATSAALRLVLGRVRVHHAGPLVALQRLAVRPVASSRVASRCQSSLLPAHLGDLRRAVPLGQRPERRPGLDRLQLLRIADQHHLGAGLGGVATAPAPSAASPPSRPRRSPARPGCVSCSRPCPHACSS